MLTGAADDWTTRAGSSRLVRNAYVELHFLYAMMFCLHDLLCARARFPHACCIAILLQCNFALLFAYWPSRADFVLLAYWQMYACSMLVAFAPRARRPAF